MNRLMSNEPVNEPTTSRAPWPCAALLLLTALGSCTSPSAFTCDDDAACEGVGPGARCEPSGFCSFEDPTCEDGGRRYGELAGEGLGGACVGPPIGTDGASTGSDPTSGPTSGPSTLDGGSSTGDGPDGEDTGPAAQAPWWDCGWAARRELVLGGTSGREILQDVPVLVVLDASRIDASIMAPDGHDLRFVADDGITVLPYDLEQWSPAGLSWAWVRVPELEEGETRLHMYYGNPDAPGLDGSEVWSGYAGVWHMGFELADATGLSSVIEVVAQTAPGQAATAQRFGSAADGVEVMPSRPTNGLFVRGGTITAMIRASGWGGSNRGFVVRRATTSLGEGGWVLGLDGNVEALRFGRGFETDERRWVSPEGSIALHTWHHVAVVYQDDAVADPVLYIDGVPQRLTAQGEVAGDPAPDELVPELHIAGSLVPATYWFDGIIDELRVDPRPRSAGWIAMQAASLRDDLVRYGPPRSATCPDSG